MGFYKQLRTISLTIGCLSFGTTALVPLPSGAVGFPETSPSDGAPSRTASGSPRRTTDALNNCVTVMGDRDGDQVREELTPMTVIAPADNVITSSDSQISLTVYIPRTEADVAEVFVYKQSSEPEGAEKEIYQEQLAVTPSLRNGSRIVTYTLPDLQLEPGHKYSWTLQLWCDYHSNNFVAPPHAFVSGTIDCTVGCDEQAQVPDPQQLTATQLVQTAQDYATQRFWDETLQLVAVLRESQPRQWQELLASQGLGCFAQVPFADDATVDFTIEDDPQCLPD